MLVLHSELDGEGLSMRHKDLEDQELVHYVETLLDADPFGSHASCVMKVGTQLLRVGRQLDALVAQTEDVALDVRIVLLGHLCHALAYRKRLMWLWSYSSSLE